MWVFFCFYLYLSLYCIHANFNIFSRAKWWTWTFLVAVQLLSHVWVFATSCTAACQASLPFTISQSLLKFISIEPVMPSFSSRYHIRNICTLQGMSIWLLKKFLKRIAFSVINHWSLVLWLIPSEYNTKAILFKQFLILTFHPVN